MAKKSTAGSSYLKRDTSKAGQVVNVGGKSVTYDSQGYAVKASNDGGAAASQYSASSGGSSSKTYSSGGSSGSYGVPDPPKAYSGSSSGSYSTPDSPSSSYGGSSYTAPSPSADYHQQARDAAARGDWSAVQAALDARQRKIDAGGGQDYGTSNAQILAQLQNQYGSSYNNLPSGAQNKLNLTAGNALPFTGVNTQTGQPRQGSIYTDKGWKDGVDYLANASAAARAGDLDLAYDALMRRGFKMADTGSTGGGTSQDQAYALIHQLYNNSQGALQTYRNKLDANSRALQEHQTQFGLQTIPDLAYKQFMSADGRYWIVYDGNGTPVAARPVSTKVGTGKTNYSNEEIDLMSQYYGGQGDRAELERQLHNLAVARTGTGRLIDSGGNWASGTPAQPVSARDWTGLDTSANTRQDTAELQAILNRINQGELFGTSQTVPQTLPENTVPQVNLPAGGGLGGAVSPGGSIGGGGSFSGSGTDDLSGYLQQMYQSNLEAQLASLRAAYEQNLANYRAHDDLISQSYQDQRNQAAAQNDLQRMYMAEMGGMQGLNTGATGQLALAQSAALQGNLANLLAAENQDRAANDLAMQNLSADYNGTVTTAMAENNADMLQSLYNEYTRQIQAAEAARKAQIEQERWLAQFDYQKQQDALAQQNWQTQWDYTLQSDRRDAAYNLASTLIGSGILPDSGTLSAAGISQTDAQALVNLYAAQMAMQQAQAAAKGSTKSSGGATSSWKPRLSEAAVLKAIKEGRVTDAVKQAYDYYYNDGAYEQHYGKGGGVDIQNLNQDQIANTHYGDFVRMSRPDGQTMAVSWDTVAEEAAKGNISAKANGDGTYTLYYTK